MACVLNLPYKEIWIVTCDLKFNFESQNETEFLKKSIFKVLV